MRLLLLAVLPLAAFGAEPAPESSVAFRADYGSANYHVLDFQGKFRIDETFDALVSLQHERADGTGSAGAARAGLGVQAFPTLHPRAAFVYRKEPNSVDGFGFDAGLDWTANPRDESEHETTLSLDFSSLTYRQKGSQPDQSRRLTQRFLQREWTFRWAQEVSESFSTLVFASIDSYAGAVGNLPNQATDFRRRPLAEGNGSIAGLPHYAVGAGMRLALSEDWRFAFDYAHAEVFNIASGADCLNGALFFQVDNDWWLGGHAGYERQELLLDTLTGGLSLAYEF